MGLVPLVTLTLTVHVVLYCHVTVTPTPPSSCPRWWTWHAPSFPVCPMSLPVFPYLPVVPVLTATLLSAMSNVWWMPIMPHSPDALLRINPCNPISNWWVLCKTVSINYWVLYLYFMEHFSWTPGINKICWMILFINSLLVSITGCMRRDFSSWPMFLFLLKPSAVRPFHMKHILRIIHINVKLSVSSFFKNHL